jgi:hypothetical protein
MTFLDTGIRVGAVLEKRPEHAACLGALEESEAPFTDAHALAEKFATLTGFYKVPVAAGTELTLSPTLQRHFAWTVHTPPGGGPRPTGKRRVRL